MTGFEGIKKPKISLLILSYFVKPGLLQLIPYEQAFAASVGQASAKLYGQSSSINGESSIYSASIESSRVGFHGNFNSERPYSARISGQRFKGDPPPFVPESGLPLASLRRYVPNRRRSKTRTTPKVIYGQPVPNSQYGYPAGRIEQPVVRVEAYASAKVQSPSGSAISSSRSYVDGSNVGSKTISLQGQQIPSDIR